MEESILEAVGAEILGIIAPVSICMLLVVLLVHSLTPHGAQAAIQSVATLVYEEKATDSNTQKFKGALLNSVVFVVIITVVTFLLVLLYYYRCIRFLKWYMCASAALVLAYMGGTVFLELIETWSIPVDVITFSIFLFNFTVLGVLSVFMSGMPILVTQFYLVTIGMLVAFWFTMLPEWTTWVLLVAMAVYDLVAVLAPGGPLNLLVELAMSRDEEIPALIYEARPTSGSRRARASGRSPHPEGPSTSASLPSSSIPSSNHGSRRWRGRHRSTSTVEDSLPSTELQPWSARSSRLDVASNPNEIRPSPSYISEVRSEGTLDEQETEISITGPILGFSDLQNRTQSIQDDGLVDEESRPLISHPSSPVSIVATVDRIEPVEVREVRPQVELSDEESDDGIGLSASGAIKLGLGDFVFYSVLVGRAAMYDLTTVYACYLAIIAGLGSTLILLAVARRALPALPISICLGVIFYFLTRLVMEPLVVGASTNLLMF